MVDVIIHSYGKPYHTLCTIGSLLKYSGQHIDKIYATEEIHDPYEDETTWAFEEIAKIKPLEHYILPEYFLTKITMRDMNDIENRWGYKYQFGIEKSDKKYVFITHNDVVYHEDIIGGMLEVVDDCAGVGLIGQCWNCSGFYAGVCDGERHDKYNPTYPEVEEMLKGNGPARGVYFYNKIDKEKPMPLPECRVNEFACLIDREVTMKECMPIGDTPLFGSYDIMDLGAGWFKSLFHKGCKFKNYDINQDCTHGYFSPVAPREYAKGKIFQVSGHPTQQDEEAYWKTEQLAKEYYEKYLK
jgi:hypothetical protein